MAKEKNKILKVIYYDENAAMDYVTIVNDGNITVEEIKKAITGMNAEVQVEGKAEIKSTLLKMLNLSAGVKSELKGNSSTEKIVNSTVTTNIMTEFIKLADTDEMIEKLSDIKLEIVEGTATYLKSIFPYLSLFKDAENVEGLKEIDINKIDEVILSTKGYFEFLAYKEQKKYAILRFNFDCFKNNYKVSDLLIMNLCYYGIKVGETTEEMMKFENEINKNTSVLVEEDLMDATSKSISNLPIYDIIIAGVKNG